LGSVISAMQKDAAMPGGQSPRYGAYASWHIVATNESLGRAMDALARQLLTSMTLASRYDVALALLPNRADLLMPIRDAHLWHAREIAVFLGIVVADDRLVVPPTVSDVDAATVLDDLREAEDAAQRQAAQACVTAPVEQATLFGTIAAALASHQEALR
jgi:hypothetical protein